MLTARLAAPAMALALTVSASAQAGTTWDESVQGELSGDGLAPTVMTFGTGANTVKGSIGGGDSDYFSFEVPAGQVLSALVMNPGTSVSGGASFIAIQAGPQVAYPVGGVGALLAYAHYDASLAGSDLLVGYLLPPSSPGLLPGTYSVWLNETGGQVPYSFDFVLAAPVPEPSAILLLAVGLGALALRNQPSRNQGRGRTIAGHAAFTAGF